MTNIKNLFKPLLALEVVVIFISCNDNNMKEVNNSLKTLDTTVLKATSYSFDSIPKGRRVVTGFNANGKSVITMDGLPPNAAVWYRPSMGNGYQAWLLYAVPTNLKDTSEPMKNGYHNTEPPKGGVVVRMTTWFPGVKYPMHQTNTIDFGIVISGNLQLGLETDSTILGPGDLVVQRGTPHSWSVVGDKPCTIAFVLVDAKKEDK